MSFVTNFIQMKMVKKFCKSVTLDRLTRVQLFWDTVYDTRW